MTRKRATNSAEISISTANVGFEADGLFRRDLAIEHADTFRCDLHLNRDLTNPPVNDYGRSGKDNDVRWKFGVPPKGNANFA